MIKHCVAGYQNALKTNTNSSKSKNIDLKSATGLANEASKLTIVIEVFFNLKFIFVECFSNLSLIIFKEWSQENRI